MPRRYVRKVGVPARAIWTEEALRKAAEAVESNAMLVNEAARKFNIPPRTLRRRISKNDFTKHGLGKPPVLGYQNEKKLVHHIQNLENAGFPCTRADIRRMAYQLAENFNIKHNFNKESKMAGKQWLQTFLERHRNLSVRQAEGLSKARALGFNREEIKGFFDLYKSILEKYDLFNKPDKIFNMDETGVQLNNKPEKVIATKGTKLVQQVTSSEKGETVSIIACNNAEGRYLPPVLIMKGVNKKAEFVDGLPPGSEVYMCKKSAYINSELFFKWITEHFIPRKPQGKVVLLLDGHASHTTNIDTLEKAAENDVILLGLPSHSTHGLQPLDKSFFKPLKTHFATELRHWILSNRERRVTRYQAGMLVGAAWGRATTSSNATNGFKACGIYPYNPNIIPEHYFNVSDMANSSVANVTTGTINTSMQPNDLNLSGTFIARSSPEVVVPQKINTEIIHAAEVRSFEVTNVLNMPSVSKENIPSTSHNTPTPSKFLAAISPIPVVAKTASKRRKQSGKVLNDDNELKHRKEQTMEKSRKAQEKENRKRQRGSIINSVERVKKRILMSHSNISSDSSSDNENGDNTVCCGCKELYKNTKSTADWIQCVICRQWLHEDCTYFGDFCNECGMEGD